MSSAFLPAVLHPLPDKTFLRGWAVILSCIPWSPLVNVQQLHFTLRVFLQRANAEISFLYHVVPVAIIGQIPLALLS